MKSFIDDLCAWYEALDRNRPGIGFAIISNAPEWVCMDLDSACAFARVTVCESGECDIEAVDEFGALLLSEQLQFRNWPEAEETLRAFLKDFEEHVSQDRTLRKVTAYITRGQGADKELLVFQHPTAGIQLPAGTIESGERASAAALRESAEESGLSGLKIARFLAEEEMVIPPNRRAVCADTDLLAEPWEGSPVLQTVGRSGFFVEAGALKGEYRQITVSHHEFVGNVFVPVRSVTGWVLGSNLATRIVRWHYEIHTTEPTPDRWTHRADREHEFAFHWAPLSEEIALVESNRAWLKRVLEKLRRSA